MVQHIVAMAISNEPRKSPPQYWFNTGILRIGLHAGEVSLPMWKFPAQWRLLMQFVDVMNVFIAMWQTLSRRWDSLGFYCQQGGMDLTSWKLSFWKRCFPWQLLGYCVYVQFQFSVLPRWFSRTLHYAGMHSDFLWSMVFSSFLSFSQLVFCTWHEGAE